MSHPTAGSGPYGIVTGPDGALWFTECQASQVGRITAQRVFTAEITTGGCPSAIALGPDGNLSFVKNNSIVKLVI